MSKNQNLHEIIYCSDGTMSIGNYSNVVDTGTKNKSNHKLYSATCKDCGTIVIKPMSDLRRMSLKCHHRSQLTQGRRAYVYGIGINDMPIGWINKNELNRRTYDVWKHMLLRTTVSFWEEYPTYEGTTVCEEWIHLSNFVNDIQTIDGYDLWKNNPRSGVMLDKDVKILGNKYYSKNTCCFLSHADSNRDVYNRHPDNLSKASQISSIKHSKKIKAINIESGEHIIYQSRKEAARVLGISTSNIWMILNNNPKYSSYTKTKSANGSYWTFEEV